MERKGEINHETADALLKEFFETHRDEIEKLRSDDPEEQRANWDRFLQHLAETEGDPEITLPEPGSEADDDPLVRQLRKILQSKGGGV